MRIGVLASGNGTVLAAMLAAGVPVQLVLVDRVCAAQTVAAAADIECVVVARAEFGTSFDRAAFTDAVGAALALRDVDLVAMAGFGTVLAPSFFATFGDRVLNTHPSLLPAFPGWHAVRDALAYGAKVTGCTVHVATAEVDHGPILAQSAVAVLPGDTESCLHERIKTVERQVYVQTIRDILERGTVL